MAHHDEDARHHECPICRGRIVHWRTTTGGERSWTIDRCARCGYAFVNPRPSLAFLLRHYASDGHHAVDVTGLADVLAKEAAYPNSSLDGERLVMRAAELGPARGRILDVGCGYGFLSQAALARGFDVTALELASLERSIATEMLGRQPVSTAFEDYETEPSSFDIVFMSQILEHALDVNAWVAKARSLLRSGGLFVVALPNFGSLFRLILQEREPYICPPDHLNFFDARSLGDLIARHGMVVERTDYVSRLPPSTFERRLRKVGPRLVAGVTKVAPKLLQVLDHLRLGQMLNVYARRP